MRNDHTFFEYFKRKLSFRVPKFSAERKFEPKFSGFDLNAGSGVPASRQASKTRWIPRPQASLSPALKKVLATVGLKGREGCWPNSFLRDQLSGNSPGFHICRRLP